jgi:hypothetical protein
MTTVTIKETQNPTILKFEFEDFITKMKVTNSKTLTTQNPLAQKLFHLAFVKQGLYLGNFIAIEKI